MFVKSHFTKSLNPATISTFILQTTFFTCIATIWSYISPAQAAQLQFNFTTQLGGSGSFILNSDAPTTGDAPLIDPTTDEIIATGPDYIGAISNFSFSAPGVGEFNSPTGDFGIISTFFPNFPQPQPSLPLALIGATAGCSVSDNPFACGVQISATYAGNVAQLPTLAANPAFYDLDLGTIVETDPTSSQLVFVDSITSQTVTSVPEPSSILALLTASAITLGIWRQRCGSRSA